MPKQIYLITYEGPNVKKTQKFLEENSSQFYSKFLNKNSLSLVIAEFYTNCDDITKLMVQRESGEKISSSLVENLQINITFQPSYNFFSMFFTGKVQSEDEIIKEFNQRAKQYGLKLHGENPQINIDQGFTSSYKFNYMGGADNVLWAVKDFSKYSKVEIKPVDK